jgi:hypothetical protein
VLELVEAAFDDVASPVDGAVEVAGAVRRLARVERLAF